MNKRGWLRIVEASIAVVLVAGFLLFIANKEKTGDNSEEIYKIQRAILETIEKNDSLREDIIVKNSLTNVNRFIRENLQASLEFEAVICDIGENCGMSGYVEESVYVDEIILSTTLENYNPKKLILFVWEK